LATGPGGKLPPPTVLRPLHRNFTIRLFADDSLKTSPIVFLPGPPFGRLDGPRSCRYDPLALEEIRAAPVRKRVLKSDFPKMMS